MLHGGLASCGGLVEGVWSRDDSDAVHRRILDSAVRDLRRTWLRDLSGERPAHQKPAGAQKRRARKPVVAEAAYLRMAHELHPSAEIRVARTYWRQRGGHVRGASTCVQRMQKALTQMNVQLANVISDLSGLTGQTIVRAI